jgi:hypothetical protein
VANGLDQFAATTSAELAGVISDETGSGALCFATSPTLVTPALGTPASGVMTNVTGTAAGLTAGNATAAVTATTATTATKSDALSTTGASVGVAAAAPPSTGQVLKATSATTATWQAEAGGGSGDFLADGTVAMTGDINLADNGIVTTSNNDLALTPNGTGEIIQTASSVIQRSGNNATVGDSQAVSYVLRTTTNTANATEFFIDGTGGSERMVVTANSAWTFTGIVVGRTDGNSPSQTVGYKFEGMIDRDGIITSLSYAGTVTELNDDTTDNVTLVVDADDTNESLRIRVTDTLGASRNPIDWCCSVQTVQVTNDLVY